VKVCIVTTAFPSKDGDQRGTFILEAARAIRRAGVQVRVLAIHTPGAKKYEFQDGIEIFRPQYLPEKWEILQSEGGGLPVIWKKRPWARLAILPFMITHTLQTGFLARDCDIIHANWTLSAVAAWASAWIHHKPMIVTVQGSDMFQAVKMPLVRALTRAALKKMKKVLALSKALAIEVCSIGISPENIEIVPNGVDLTRFPVGKSIREPIILYVASLIERKGPKFLIQAFQGVNHRFPDARLIMIGDGLQRQELESMATALGVSDRVEFLGWQTQQKVSEWMRKAKIFTLPSVEEGLGVVLLEALASGTVCVGSNVGGIPDVITPEVGILVPPGDPKSLQIALEHILESDKMWQDLSIHARYRAEELYNWDQIASRILSIYQSSIQSK
jgi:glycosyltransferase involved in cell wall biosynthesis